MTKIIKKIITINFQDNQFLALNETLSEYELLSSPISDDIENTLKTELPDAIMINTKLLNIDDGKLKIIAELSKEKNIPLFYLASSLENTDFVNLVKRGACNIITAPILKDDFIFRLNSYNTCCEKLKNDEPKKIKINILHENTTREMEIESDNLNILINSLINNLRNQIKFSKRNLKIKNSLKDEQNSAFTPEEKEIENMLWNAFEKNHFRLFYQPVISLKDDRLFGFEALIRIDDPVKGIINPGDFIDVAERSDIIYPLGLWIIETACKQIHDWKSKFQLNTPLKINTNLSSNQFLHDGLADDILEITDRYETNHQDIGFELTESTFMEDMEKANLALLQLRSKDFHIYMDDFGTGYSSLSYLTHFPMNVLKIDQSFVQWMHIDEQSETIVKSIISMSHSLGLKVVAEGTDDDEHIEMLKKFECDYAQGYLYSKPMPPELAEEYILKHFELKEDI